MIQFSQRNPLFTNEKNVDVPVKAKQEWLFCLLVFTKMEIKCCKTEYNFLAIICIKSALMYLLSVIVKTNLRIGLYPSLSNNQHLSPIAKLHT